MDDDVRTLPERIILIFGDLAGRVDGTLDFTIPKRPIKKRITGIPAFTTIRGGAYFFLPGVQALRWLAAGARAEVSTNA